MHKWGSEAELNAQLRFLTGELRRLREELRGVIREPPYGHTPEPHDYPPAPTVSSTKRQNRKPVPRR